MAGKSTYLRQNALITILAQTGCFVPADYAELGLVDKIFSRVRRQQPHMTFAIADNFLGRLSGQPVQSSVDIHGGDARSCRYPQPSNSTLIR